MSEASSLPGPSPRRRRHRTIARKVAESLALYVGAPLLLLALLALSVELIEYRPSSGPVRVEPASALPSLRVQRLDARATRSPAVERSTLAPGLDQPALAPGLEPQSLESLPPLD